MDALAKLAALAAVVALASCCSQAADTKTVQVAQVPTAALIAHYSTAYSAPAFTADVQVDAGDSCKALDASATAELSGVELTSTRSGQAACFCEGSRFSGAGPIPAQTDAMLRVVDDSGEMAATVPNLFVARSVSVRSSPAALRIGSRVYLDVVPAGETMTQVSVSFRSRATVTTLFTLRSSDGTVGQDANGWYFDVPNVATGEGKVTLTASARVAASSCVGAARCEVTAATEGALYTSIVAP